MKYSLKGHKGRNRHKKRIKRSGQARLVYVKNIHFVAYPVLREKQRRRNCSGFVAPCCSRREGNLSDVLGQMVVALLSFS